MRRWVAVAAVLGLVAAGCSSADDGPSTPRAQDAPSSDATPDEATPGDAGASHQGHSGHTGDHGTAPPATRLRAGERFVDLAMPAAYQPAAPTYGTDDYRCFVLDPHLAKPAFVTGVDVVPGRPELVHHVILFRVGPDQVADAEQADADDDGEGWTCFGGTGLDAGIGAGLDSAPWLGAWAPGGGESVMARDIGIPLEAGSRIIMQVHYNLLAGDGTDQSSARLRMAPGTAALKPLETMLLPAPIELPCRPSRADEPLCDRDAAVADVAGRFGFEAGATVGGLQLLCGGDVSDPHAGNVQHCDRNITRAGTIRAVAGHMHLLGREITIELNPGQPDHRTLLHVDPWNFDQQGSIPLQRPAAIEPGDVLRVTCRHDQRMRDRLPALADQPERYVVWGEGTTDEMCLGIVLLTRD